jgi:phosphoglycolate phosphatase
MRKLVIFDFDGTLADSAGWFIETLPALAGRHRFHAPSAQEIERLRGRPTREVLAAMRIPAWRLPAIARDLRQRAAKETRRIALFDGVADALTALARSGAMLAIVSSNAETHVRAVLGAQAESVSVFACGASLFGKARLIRRVLGQTGVAASQAIYVGDELRDISAARAAGVASAAVNWGYGRADALAKAGADHLLQVPSALAQLTA